jgi:transposase
VDGLDLSSIISNYKGGGTSSFHPRMMIKVLFYSYLSNIYSCRKIEKALQENIYFMWLSHNWNSYKNGLYNVVLKENGKWLDAKKLVIRHE